MNPPVGRTLKGRSVPTSRAAAPNLDCKSLSYKPVGGNPHALSLGRRNRANGSANTLICRRNQALSGITEVSPIPTPPDRVSLQTPTPTSRDSEPHELCCQNPNYLRPAPDDRGRLEPLSRGHQLGRAAPERSPHAHRHRERYPPGATAVAGSQADPR